MATTKEEALVYARRSAKEILSQVTLEIVMSANIAVVSPPEETTSVVTRNRIVCFVNDDLSAAALRTGLEGSNLEVKHAVSALLLFRKSGTTTNDPSIVRI